MTEKRPRLAVEKNPSHTHVSLLDAEILHELQIRQIEQELTAVLTAGSPIRLLLDFGAVGRLSSMALGMLTVIHKRVMERGGQLRLCRIHPQIYQVFELSKLNRVLHIYDTAEEAIAAFE